jgi:hypothetical protein
MSTFKQSIRIYGRAMDDFEASPFETVDLLHRRSRIQRHWDELDPIEKAALKRYDRRLVRNAKRVYRHINQVYDFSMSDEPLEEWWWHLDKVAEGKLNPPLLERRPNLAVKLVKKNKVR